MRNLLFLVLIAFVVSSSVQKIDLKDLEIILKSVDWEGLWNQVKDNANQAYEWLKRNGIWDVVMDAVKIAGPTAAGAGCQSIGIPAIVCSSIVSFILSYAD